MVHGPRCVTSNAGEYPRSVWAGRLKLRRGTNIATVALANKNARVIWALLTRGEKCCASPHPAPMPRLRARRKSEEEDLPKGRGCERNSDGETGRTGTFSNLTVPRALEVAKLIRRRCADFHQGPGLRIVTHAPLQRGRILAAAGSSLTRLHLQPCATGSGPYMGTQATNTTPLRLEHLRRSSE